MNELINITLNENHEPVVIILDEEDDFDFEETEEEIQAEYEAEYLADDTQDIINWINESSNAKIFYRILQQHTFWR